MSDLTHHSKLHIPDDCTDPIGEIEIFLRVNGYTITVDGDGLVAQRGEKGRGFWTSDLTILPTTLEAQKSDQYVDINYTVDTSGQILNQIEKQLWKREALAIQTFLEGGPIENFKESQRLMADDIRARFMKRGFYLSVALAFILFIVGFLILK